MSSNSSGSGVSCQKSLMMRAWRERWSDVQWSIHAKRLLLPPAAQPGSANQLTELLLQQTLVGSSPNMTVLSYLRHAVSTQMVTVSSVISFIVKYEDFEKIYCTRALLDLVENFSKRASTVGNYEDSLQVARSLLALLQWLLNFMKFCMNKVSEDDFASEYCPLAEKVGVILDIMQSNPYTVGLLHVAHLEDESTYDEIQQLYAKVVGSSSKLTAGMSEDNKKKLLDGLKIVNNIHSLHLPMQAILDASCQSLNASLNVLLNIEAIMKSTNDIGPFVEQILIVEVMQGLDRPTLYCELMRTSLAGMVDSSGGHEELRWAAFTFLKIPQILSQLVAREADQMKPLKSESGERDSLLLQGFNMLLNYVPLLDLTDTKCGADCMHFLLNEVSSKYSLLPASQCQHLSKRRASETRKPPKSTEQQNSQPSASLILRAEHTVNSILKQLEKFTMVLRKTLDADYSKNQEALLGVLCHMMSGKSFELILAAAAATGKLQSFAIKLIKFNELSKQTTGEVGKGAQTRLLLFDISFLMLCHFTQLYGTEIVCSHPDSQSSYFLQWATHCLPEGGKYKSPDLFTPPDPAKVDALLAQFNPGGELKITQTRWQEVCQHAPHAVQQVLNAWEYGALNDSQVKTIIENVKSQLCCLPVVVSTYLCSIINMLDSAHREKPLSFLAQLRQPITSNSSTTQPAANTQENDYYSERYKLMSNIVCKVVQAVLPVEQRVAPDYELSPSSTPAYDALTETFRTIFSRGVTSIRATQKMEYLLNLTGPTCFSQHLVSEVLHKDRGEDLSRALGITYALFNMDLESLVLSLVLHTIPGLLQATGSRLNLLIDPKGKALAQLAVMSLVLLHKHKQTAKDSSLSATIKRGRKRTLSQVSFEEKDFGEEERPVKMRKQMDGDDADAEDPFSFSFPHKAANTQKEEPSPEKGGPDLKDPIHKALLKLFRIMSAIVSCGEVNQRSGFVVSFIKEVLKSGSENIRWILQFMPLSMIPRLLMLMSSDCNTTVLLSLCDLSTSQGRSAATKVISQNAKQQTTRLADTRVPALAT